MGGAQQHELPGNYNSKPWNIASHLLGWLLSKRQEITKAREAVEKRELIPYWYNYGKKYKVSFKLKIALAYDSAILLLGIHPKEMKTPSQIDMCPPMFMAAMCIVAKAWEQPKCLLIDERIKMWCIYCGRPFSHKKRRKSCDLRQHGWTWGS